jgi:hypothetical protein
LHFGIPKAGLRPGTRLYLLGKKSTKLNLLGTRVGLSSWPALYGLAKLYHLLLLTRRRHQSLSRNPWRGFGI